MRKGRFTEEQMVAIIREADREQVCVVAKRHGVSEFVSRALLSWIVTQDIGTALIEPGKPWQNGVTESFNGKFRDECLSLEWFRSRAEAKVIIESWRQHFNAVRPHSSLGYLTPNEFAAQLTNAAPGKATGRGAAVHGPSRPGPLHHPPRERQMQQTMGAVSS